MLEQAVSRGIASVLVEGFGCEAAGRSQAIALGVAAAALWWLGHNTANTLDQHGISLGFGFLRQPANFEIGDAPIAYSPADTFVRAILVGLANTARVSVLGWILAIALGFVLGILRLATQPRRARRRAGESWSSCGTCRCCCCSCFSRRRCTRCRRREARWSRCRACSCRTVGW